MQLYVCVFVRILGSIRKLLGFETEDIVEVLVQQGLKLLEPDFFGHLHNKLYPVSMQNLIQQANYNIVRAK